ncbi:hypothetical protein C9J01_10195 [Photobacterium rosenbergii]|uniref:Uncharacterized protein n=1 Tax=Photobacterium rosenbergii TaxID=294936 RepID=A0A2T3NF62_9GAMM|nr:hypothetical protein [Photobacterium rosenbergii]PSW13216.1 hypothetical protein C9J01_10195 [Photobacterium rosenbergii]
MNLYPYAERSVLNPYTVKSIVTAIVIVFGLGMSSGVEAKKYNHNPNNKSNKVTVVKAPAKKTPTKVVVVNKRSAPSHKHYHRNSLPKIATFAVISGVSYAIVDNFYYKRQGDSYIHVDNPRR